jgi:hypothetical protein
MPIAHRCQQFPGAVKRTVQQCGKHYMMLHFCLPSNTITIITRCKILQGHSHTTFATLKIAFQAMTEASAVTGSAMPQNRSEIGVNSGTSCWILFLTSVIKKKWVRFWDANCYQGPLCRRHALSIPPTTCAWVMSSFWFHLYWFIQYIFCGNHSLRKSQSPWRLKAVAPWNEKFWRLDKIWCLHQFISTRSWTSFACWSIWSSLDRWII